MDDAAGPPVLAAHTPNAEGRWHSLGEHLLGTASKAAEFGRAIGLADAAWWAGLWHDVGKGSTCVFQPFLRLAATDAALADKRYPRSQRGHKAVGARLAIDAGCPGAAFAVDGHHGGLRSLPDIRALRASTPNEPDLVERVAIEVGRSLRPDTPIPWPTDGRDPLAEEMTIRFLASCLVDADFLDTEAHFNGDVDRAADSFATVAQSIRDGVAFRAPAAPIDAARNAYRDHVRRRARESKPGVYRMTGRTGVGKTLTGLTAAIDHALANSQRRVVIAVPYTTVTEQVADAIRAHIPAFPHAVLEHHSAIEEGKDNTWRRLAAENWDAPVVVTTTVQLFESLFSRTPSRMRKLHRLASSVIILDEAQTLPALCLEPIIDALDWLVRYAGATVVLQTATQPAFDLVGPLNGRDLPDWGDIDLGPVFDRVTWHHHGELDHEAVAAHLSASTRSVLCVVNTVRDALSLSDRVPGSLCLSTRLCPDHRRRELDRIRSALNGGGPVRVVATQMVEAGIDLDFPEVWRAEAPLTSLAQAAGRCNRNARLDGKGTMATFELAGGSLPPGEYRIGTQFSRDARQQFVGAFNPEDVAVLRWWFEQLYGHGRGTGPVPFDRPRRSSGRAPTSTTWRRPGGSG